MPAPSFFDLYFADSFYVLLHALGDALTDNPSMKDLSPVESGRTVHKYMTRRTFNGAYRNPTHREQE